MNNRKVDPNTLMNGWLKYFNTSVEEIIAKNPKENIENPTWFKDYVVTPQQYEEWKIWAKKLIKDTTKCSNRLLEREFSWIDLELGPLVKIEL